MRPIQSIITILLISGLFFPFSILAQVNITFMIKDVDFGSTLKDVNIYAFDEKGYPVFEGLSNDVGFFTITTDLKAGQQITVVFQKKGYKLLKETFFIKFPDPNANIWDVKLIPKPSSDEIDEFTQPLSGHIYDKKSQRKGTKTPLRGVKVDILTEEGRRIEKTKSNSSGYFILYHDFEPGEKVILYFDLSPNYEILKYRHIYPKSNKAVLPDIYLKKKRKIPLEAWGFLGTASFSTLGILYYNSSNKLYDQYSDVANIGTYYNTEQERQDDYDKANSQRGIGISGLCVGGAALASTLVYMVNRKKKAKVETSIDLDNLFGYNQATQTMEIGIKYNF